MKTTSSVKTTNDFQNSHFFGGVDSDVVKHVFARQLLYFSVESGYMINSLRTNGKFNSALRITGTSTDRNGNEFVSMIEHRQYPLVATVFQTERTQFERHGPNGFLPRDEYVIDFSFKFMMSIVNRLRNPAKRLDRVDGLVRAYFANYYNAERGAWDELEQVYKFNRLHMDEGIPMTYNEQLKKPKNTNTNAHTFAAAGHNSHASALIAEKNFDYGTVEEKTIQSPKNGLERIYNVLIVLCILLSLNMVVLGLYMRKIDVLGFLKSKLSGNTSTEHQELLK